MFIEQRLLDRVAYGTQAGLEYRTEVRALRSGVESRARLWALPLARYTVVYRSLRPADRAVVVEAFRAAGGRHLAFRFRDPLDFTAEQEALGVAAGGVETLQLTKRYQFGPVIEVAPIHKPVSVQLFADGVPITAAVDLTTGQVTVDVAAGAVLTWSGAFDKPVRFDSDQLMWSLDAPDGVTPGRLASTDVTLSEVRL